MYQLAARVVEDVNGERRGCTPASSPARSRRCGPVARVADRDARRKPRASRVVVAGVDAEERDLLAERRPTTLLEDGNSARHGPHHDAHLLTTTGWPAQRARAARSNAAFGRRQQLVGLRVQRRQRRRRAGERAAAPRGGDRRRARGFVAAARVWVSPMTRTATTRDGDERRQTRRRMRRQRRGRGLPTAPSGHAVCFDSRDREGRPGRSPLAARSPGRSRSLGSRSRRPRRPRSHRQSLSWLRPPQRPSRPHPSLDPTTSPRAEKFTRERFVHEGEDAAVALAPGTPRRRALDAALAELARGREGPVDGVAARATRCCSASSALLSRGRAAARRRHAAQPAPGRRAVGHADRAARRGAGRNGNGASNGHAADGGADAAQLDADEPTSALAAPGEEDDDEERRRADEEPQDWDEPSRRGDGRGAARRAAARTPTPPSASGSSTRPAPARRSPRSASSRPRAPAAS